jgi:small subunit ribosomal protein S6
MHQKKYDVIYIMDPNSTAEDLTAVSSKIEQIITDAKGSILKKDDWGKRRLAYLVQKHREGHYVFFHVTMEPETVAEVTRNLRLIEKVIKHTIVKDEISHLKPRPKPVRKGPALDGPNRGSSGSYRPRSSAPRAPEAAASKSPEAAAPKAPEAAEPKAPEAPVAPPVTPTTPTN